MDARYLCLWILALISSICITSTNTYSWCERHITPGPRVQNTPEGDYNRSPVYCRAQGSNYHRIIQDVSAILCDSTTGQITCSDICCTNSNLFTSSLFVCCSSSANSALNTANNIVGNVATGVSTVIIVVIVVSCVILLGIILCIACCVYQATKKPKRTVGAIVVQSPPVVGPPAHTTVNVPPPQAGGPR